MIDLHSHVLPGLDDGAQTIEDSVEIARAAEADGIRTIAGTPHVRSDFPTTPERMEAALRDVRSAVQQAGLRVEVVSGGEVALDRIDAVSRDDLRRFTLGGTGRYLLVEFPYGGWPLDLERRVFELVSGGLAPVLAHPERSPDVQEDPFRLTRAVAGGALVQVTAAALDGRLGRTARRTALRLVELRLAHVIASDAHRPDVRAVGLSEARHAIGSERLGEWLVEDAPAAILAGEDLPPRPEGRRRRFGIF